MLKERTNSKLKLEKIKYFTWDRPDRKGEPAKLEAFEIHDELPLYHAIQEELDDLQLVYSLIDNQSLKLEIRCCADSPIFVDCNFVDCDDNSVKIDKKEIYYLSQTESEKD